MVKTIKTPEVFAVVPARGGSKGIPRKNLRKIAGKTLVEWAIRIGLNCPFVCKTILSTDDPEIAQVGREAGAWIPFLRPRRLAGDKALVVNAVLHLLQHIEEAPSIVLLLQPTAPLRTIQQASEALQFLLKNPKVDAVVSVVPLEEPHPLKVKVIEQGWLTSYIKSSDSQIPRQLMPRVYKLNGAIYAVRVGALRKERTFLPKRTLPYVMPPETGINIDTPFDLLVLESLVNSRAAQILPYFT